jgi:hypothetical protein
MYTVLRQAHESPLDAAAKRLPGLAITDVRYDNDKVLLRAYGLKPYVAAKAITRERDTRHVAALHELG